MQNTFNFKRFVTFGLGLGMVMSAATGFAQTTLTGSTLSVQGNTLNANNGTLTLVGERADGTSTRGVTIDANGYITAKGIVLNNGALSDGISGAGTISAQNLTSTNTANMNNLTVSGSTTLNGAVNVNNQVLNANKGIYVNGNLITGVADAALTAASQQAVNGRQLNATNVTVTNNAAKVANITTSGTTTTVAGAGTVTGAFSAAEGSFLVDSTGLTKAQQGLQVNGAAGLTVGTNFAVTSGGVVSAASGTVTTGARVVNNGVISYTATSIADGSDVAAAKTEAIQAAAIDAATKANAAEANANTYTDGKVARVDGRIDSTNDRITQQSGADRTYTDNQVGNERNRAMAAEAAISKEVRQVGAMAMAAAGVAGATPVGDKKTAITAAVGTYSGQTAIAVGVTRLMKDNVKAFGAFSKVDGGRTGLTVGASFSF